MRYGSPSQNRRHSGEGGKYSPPSSTTNGAARREPEEIGAILSRWLRKNRVAERAKEEGIFQYWKEIVGEEIARQTRVVKCAAGVLTVEVASAPLLLELSGYYREGILESIRARPECGGIHDLRFRAGGSVPTPLGPPKGTSVPTPLAVPSPSVPEGRVPEGTVAPPRSLGGGEQKEGTRDWKKA